MKKLIIGLVLIAVVGGLIYLVNAGIITWQPLTILVAALAAPFKFVMSLFGSEEKIHKKHEERRRKEHEFQEQLESRIQEREENIANLVSEIESLHTQVNELKTENQNMSNQIHTMSATAKSKLGQDLLGG
ncbi:MAG: hypothetical protein ACE5IR_01515 [bacterium]